MYIIIHSCCSLFAASRKFQTARVYLFQPGDPVSVYLLQFNITRPMSYQVLARRWRPKSFAEVIGQEHVLRALSNALTQGRLHHAYLFTGTRGVGKTTIARILAKCLNCATGITATPCGQCDACLEIDAGRFVDLIEVDAASRTKVEDTRDLLANVQYMPTAARFKIYLIDEVHMLSGHSFNALLKTLEEPPEHVKFLLATTDPQRLPVTVLSRCLQFNLKALSPELIQQQLTTILDKEKITYEPEALRYLAIAAQGSVRDALSLLDQAIAYGGDNRIQTADVRTMLGAIETTHITRLLTTLAEKNVNASLQIIAELTESAVDFSNVLDELLDILHKIALLQIAPDLNVTTWNNLEQLQILAKAFTPEDVQLYYQIALIGKRDLPLAPTLKSGFEMLILRMHAFQLEAPQPKATAQQPIATTAPITKPKATAIPTGSAPITTNNDLLSQLKVTGTTQALIRHCSIANIDNANVDLLLDAAQAPLLNKTQEERLSIAFSELLKRPVKTHINIKKTGNATNKIDIAPNANSNDNLPGQKNPTNVNSVENDPNVKKLMKAFNANVIPESIERAE
jgi:DNA polymerase III subunit gamma/tau